MTARCLNIFIDHQSCNKGPRLYTDNKDVIVTTTTKSSRLSLDFPYDTGIRARYGNAV